MIIAHIILALGYTGLLAAAIIGASFGYSATWFMVFLPLGAMFLVAWSDVFSHFSFARLTPEGAKEYLINLMVNMSDADIADLRKDYENDPTSLAFFDTLVEEAKKKRDENKED